MKAIVSPAIDAVGTTTAVFSASRCFAISAATNGTKAPLATSALALFSNNSTMSNGFFSTPGTAVPSESLRKHSVKSAKPVPQAHGCAYHGSDARA
jgi:hypothetical protein